VEEGTPPEGEREIGEEVPMTIEQRLSIHDVEPSAYEAVLAMERYVRNSTLPKPLYEQ
jgi:hypothetical protein